MEQYEKIRVVGRGAYGTVYLCVRLIDQRQVIIKQIPVEQMTKEERQVALNEAKVLSMLDHPNIIEYYENFLEDKALMIVMEYAEGGTVFEYLQQRGKALLEEQEVMHLFVQILLSLQHVHSKQILHRDLKTQNILLNKDRDVVKIGDFGISKVLSSKSKAFTVVGTPCYISPELCEGKPYNQKSDIWAVGCVLYELLSLKRAFEAANLPALVMKIMRGAVSPISDQYSEELKKLLLNMLHLDPDKRPTINQVIAEPIVIKALVKVYMEMGRVKCSTKLLRTLPRKNSDGKGGSRESSARSPHRGSMSSVVLDGSSGLAKVQPLSSIYCWGHGVTSPIRLPLPNSDTQIIQVSSGRTQKAGVTTNGRLIIWESPSVGTDAILPGATEQQIPTYVPRYLEGQSAVTIRHVSCGDMFTACLTDRGILMTFGSGSHGCLGHGNYHDVSQAKIVEALLGYEVVQVSCGQAHVMAVTNEHEVFAWGRGDNGRLGLNSQDPHASPQSVQVPDRHKIRSVFCGLDCSLLLTTKNRLLCCGSNRCNKLGLDLTSQTDQTVEQVEHSWSLRQARSWPLPQLDIKRVAIGISHSAIITENGRCLTLGSNQFGQLGCQKSGNKLPRIACLPALPQDSHIVDIACGDMFTIALSKDGTLYTWGKGSRGRLGRKEENTGTPLPVTIPSDNPLTVISISCSHGNTLLATKPLEEESVESP